MRVLVSITTTNKDYLKKIKEIKKYKIKEIALFLTLYATKNIRHKIYKALINCGVKSIPVVHLRNDMTGDEIEYLKKKFRTKMFNTHPKGFFQLDDPKLIKKYKKIIYLENTEAFSMKKEIDNFAGICFDVSHLHDAILKKKKLAKETIEILKNYKCGFAHLSEMRENAVFDKYEKSMSYCLHHFENINEFDYIKKYRKYLPYYIALEIDNPIKEQLLAKKYIEKILK